MVGISYNHGVVLCEQYSGAINGEKMAEIVYSSFYNAFEQSSDPKGRRFLQDGCPRQNSKAARVAFEYVNATVLKIKQHADKNRHSQHSEFAIGDTVPTKNLPDHRTKLSKTWRSTPYKIIKVYPSSAQVQDERGSTYVRHHSHLRPYYSHQLASQPTTST